MQSYSMRCHVGIKNSRSGSISTGSATTLANNWPPPTGNAMKRIGLAMEFFDFADTQIFAYCQIVRGFVASRGFEDDRRSEAKDVKISCSYWQLSMQKDIMEKFTCLSLDRLIYKAP